MTFTNALHAEWTKFRTVRGWLIGMVAAAAAIMAFGLVPGMQGSCGEKGSPSECAVPIGPEGQEVTDSFLFVHQQLAGDGSITVRLASFTGVLPSGPDEDAPRAGLAPWAKAGLIIKDGTKQGSAYAAIMFTGSHGVRVQHNYVHDVAGSSDARWLRLTRSGATITGEQSVDGTHWTVAGTVRLDGLPSTVEAGLFVTSPQYSEESSEVLGLTGASTGPSRATAAFSDLSRTGTWPAQSWTGEHLGGSSNMPELRGNYEETSDGFTVTGSGDIAPAVAGANGIGTSIAQTLAGTFIGLIIMVVIGTMFASTEYRRGLIRTTLTASPRRVQVLAAKAIVIGGITYLAGLAAATVVVTLGPDVLRHNGVYVHAVTTATEIRVIAGTAALLAVGSVLGLALGAVLRRSTTAVTVAIVTIVLPYLLALTVLPSSAGQWLLRISPAASFALQQSTEQYAQVSNIYTPVNGYFPLAPWAGFAVLAGWTVLALGLAAYVLRRRDA
jgi:ABC-type transport system involved in multi-copper enzyme maturation permease subunit